MSLATHADSEQSDIERAKAIVARILAMRRGPDHAIAGEELAERTPVAYTTLRDIIPEIIAEYRIPVTSSDAGYYRIDSHDEFVSEMHRYESQREAARERMQALSQAFYGQEDLF